MYGVARVSFLPLVLSLSLLPLNRPRNIYIRSDIADIRNARTYICTPNLRQCGSVYFYMFCRWLDFIPRVRGRNIFGCDKHTHTDYIRIFSSSKNSPLNEWICLSSWSSTLSRCRLRWTRWWMMEWRYFWWQKRIFFVKSDCRCDNGCLIWIVSQE